ncbi:hypothetical protein Cni_G14342 [Canna indica]|uniref:Uncharacterized protein n=1 Tax=Canna indica TaxID=4628 RepID=A0AAQ3KB99_9LILI|nr:hypothetical protein Cni_G14342 [Canna indica]
MICRGGGIIRLKTHLAGTSDDVVKCTKVPPEVRQMFKDMLTNKKEQRLKNVAQQAEFDRLATQEVSGGHYEARGGGDDEDAELEAGIRASLEHAAFERDQMYYPGSHFEYDGSSGSGGTSSVGTSAAGSMDRSGSIPFGPQIGRSSSMRVPQSRGAIRGFFTSLGASGRKTNAIIFYLDLMAFPPPSAKQPRIDDAWGKTKKWELGRAISKLFHFSRIPANATNNPYYRTMMSTIQNVGSGKRQRQRDKRPIDPLDAIVEAEEDEEDEPSVHSSSSTEDGGDDDDDGVGGEDIVVPSTQTPTDLWTNE